MAWGESVKLDVPRVAMLLGVGALVVATLAVLGAGGGLWPPRIGVVLVEAMVVVAVATVFVALGAIWTIARRGRHGAPQAAMGLAAAIVLIGAWSNQHYAAHRYPPIHEATTSLDRPPAFRKLAVTPNAAEPVPDGGRADLAGLSDAARWQSWHRERYADLHAITVPWPVAEAVRRAARLGRERGWTIALADPHGHLEASDVASAFGFVDDVALDFRSAPAGGTRVEMRSLGREPGGDGGRNAARVRGFLASLAQTARPQADIPAG